MYIYIYFVLRLILLCERKTHTFQLTYFSVFNVILSFFSHSSQLGTSNPSVNHTSPTLVDLSTMKVGERVFKVAAGAIHSACLTVSGGLYMWGSNVYDNILDMGKFVSGGLYMWGSNVYDNSLDMGKFVSGGLHIKHSSLFHRFGQLGLGDRIDRSLPSLVNDTTINGKSNPIYSDVQCGARFTLALEGCKDESFWPRYMPELAPVAKSVQLENMKH